MRRWLVRLCIHNAITCLDKKDQNGFLRWRSLAFMVDHGSTALSRSWLGLKRRRR